MNCQKCNSDRVLGVSAKAKDMHHYSFKNETIDQTYALNFNSYGDYTEFKVCMDCGQMQGEFPMVAVGFDDTNTCDMCENLVDECTCPK